MCGVIFSINRVSKDVKKYEDNTEIFKTNLEKELDNVELEKIKF